MINERLAPHDNDPRPTSASVDFIFVDHSEGNLPRVAQAVLASDGDIIAIEKIREGSFGMGTAEEKAHLSELMTRFIAVDNPIGQSAREYFQTEEPFFTQLLDGLKGSGKQIVLIDMGTDDAGYVHHQRNVTARHTCSESLQTNPDASEDSLLDYIIAAAQSYEYREHVMSEQIASLAHAHPEKKITVMAGARHTQLSHRVGARTFVPTEEESATHEHGQRVRFDEVETKIRKIRFNLKKLGLSVLNNDHEVAN